MTKAELVAALQAKAGIDTKAEAEKALAALLETIGEALAADEKVVLTGFGSFSTSVRKERTGRNPQTGAAITIPSSKVVKFSAGKMLKDAVQS